MDSIDTIYCINLRRRTDRLTHFLDKYPNNLMGKLKIVGAVDSLTHVLSEEDLVKLKKADWDINVGRGQWGCSFSHESVWRNIIENKLEYAIVLEDDAVFSRKDDLVDFLKMFKMLELRVCFLGPENHPENTPKTPHDFNDLQCPCICKLKSNLGSMSYIITLNGAKDLVKIIDTVGHYRAVDQIINDYMKQKQQWFCISPPCFSVADLGTDIP
jgi:glycosyl transferase family 25